MATKRKNYTTAEKLKINEEVTNGESKGSLFRMCGIPDGTARLVARRKQTAFVCTFHRR
jgi:hypothetical protein